MSTLHTHTTYILYIIILHINIIRTYTSLHLTHTLLLRHNGEHTYTHTLHKTYTHTHYTTLTLHYTTPTYHIHTYTYTYTHYVTLTLHLTLLH
jgi:hypothetical protein